jgi:hypothetical protein
VEKKGRELKKLIKELSPGKKKDLERSYLCEKALDLVMERGVAVDGALPTDDIISEMTEEE